MKLLTALGLRRAQYIICIERKKRHPRIFQQVLKVRNSAACLVRPAAPLELQFSTLTQRKSSITYSIVPSDCQALSLFWMFFQLKTALFSWRLENGLVGRGHEETRKSQSKHWVIQGNQASPAPHGEKTTGVDQMWGEWWFPSGIPSETSF